MNKFFCNIPWTHYTMRPNGYIRVCCFANQGPTNGILIKDDGSPYTYKDKISESRNCKLLKDIRVSLLNNKWHPECIRCEREYNSGSEKTRLIMLKKKNRNFSREDAIIETHPDGSIDTNQVPILHYDLRLGNKCNLRCRMCYATDSDGWYQDLYKIYGQTSFMDIGREIKVIEKDGKYVAEKDPYHWFDEDIFWDNLKEYIHTIKSMYIVGGEPMLISKHFDFLEGCDNSKNIEVAYNTNLTVVPNKGINIWKKFKNVHFGVSIDGHDKVNEYIRHPSKWDIIERNFKRLAYNKNFSLDISTTISVFNILRFIDIIKWSADNIKNKIIPFNPHPLHAPPFYNIRSFPVKSKLIIEQTLSKQIMGMKNDGYSNEIINIAKQFANYYISFMNQEHIKGDVKLFWEINDKMDYYRNQKMSEYIPELIKLIPREI